MWAWVAGYSPAVPRIRVLVIILAGGAGGRLELLTHSRAKPAVPFAGTHRLIDFALSNCLNAQISDVWISQFNPVSLSGHVANLRFSSAASRRFSACLASRCRYAPDAAGDGGVRLIAAVTAGAIRPHQRSHRLG